MVRSFLLAKEQLNNTTAPCLQPSTTTGRYWQELAGTEKTAA